MFTGIVQGKAEVTAIEHREQFMTLQVQLPMEAANNLQTGASIAINGTCLTITAFKDTLVSFDVISETLRVTNLGKLQLNDVVNFERAAKFGDEIGGHLLSGHVSDQVEITAIDRDDNNCILWLKPAAAMLPYILPKGFIALNGCSLTIGEVRDQQFNIYLIPETLAVTTFGEVKVGDRINLEVDPQTQAVVDTVNRYLEANPIGSK